MKWLMVVLATLVVPSVFGAQVPDTVATLDPMRGYIGIGLRSNSPPTLKLYRSQDLAGSPSMIVDGRGVTLDGVLICVWNDGAFDPAIFGRAFLVRGRRANEPCPASPPFKFDAKMSRVLYIELAAIDGPTGRVDYRGRPFYFSLHSLPGNPFAFTGLTLIRWPENSPPLIGGIDIPSVFRPRSRPRRFTLNLRASPRDDAAVMATVSSLHLLDTFSLGDGALAAAVYARTNRWSLVRLFDGRTGWLARQDSGKFVSLERLVQWGSDMYMADWDRTLTRAPGDRERTRVPSDPRRAWLGYVANRLNPSAEIRLFDAPHPEAAPARILKGDEAYQLASVRLRDGAMAPIVLSRTQAWLEVALDRDAACYRHEQAKRMWIRNSASDWNVVTPSTEEKERLLNEAWGPEASPRAEVLETKRVQGVLWIRVNVLMGEACEPVLCDTPRVVLGEGWLPAIGKSGRPSVWFETYCD